MAKGQKAGGGEDKGQFKSFFTPDGGKNTQSRTPAGGVDGSPEDVVEVAIKTSLSDHGGRRDIDTEKGAFAEVLCRYKDGSISMQEKRSQKKGTIYLVTTMETVSVQRWCCSGGL